MVNSIFHSFQSPSVGKDIPTPLLVGFGGKDQSESIFATGHVRICLEQAVNGSTPMENLACFDVQKMSSRSLDRDGKNTGYRSGGARTLMICNIPCRVRHVELVEAINSMGFGDTFESVHLPRYDSSDSNLGYGFVHFFCKADAERFALVFDGYRFSQRGSTKACTVKIADRQHVSSPSFVGSFGKAQDKPSRNANFDTTASDRNNRNHGARTMMICNIPCRVSHSELTSAIDSIGYGGTYEFVHIPTRFGQSDSNLGYGFAHFFRESDAERFAIAFDGYRFSQRGSTKAVTVKVADCQGRDGGQKRRSRNVRLTQQKPP